MTNKQMNQTLAAVCSFVFILGMVTVVLIIKAKGELAPTLSDRLLTECERVDLREHSEDVAAILFSHEYKGDYRDGSDNYIYSPACNIPTAPWLSNLPVSEIPN